MVRVAPPGKTAEVLACGPGQNWGEMSEGSPEVDELATEREEAPRPLEVNGAVRRVLTEEEMEAEIRRLKEAAKRRGVEPFKTFPEAVNYFERHVFPVVAGANWSSLQHPTDGRPRFPEEVLSVLDAWVTAEPLQNLLLVGSVGVGKSFAAAAIARRLAAERSLRVMFVSANIVTDLSRPLPQIEDCSVVVLDDVGDRGTDLPPFAADRLNSIVSRGYNAMKRFIVTTNLPVDEFRSFVGERVFSRLRESGLTFVELSGPDRRVRQPERSDGQVS